MALRKYSFWPWFLALVVAIAGVAISLHLSRTRAAMDQRALEKRFLAEAQRVKDAVAQEVDLSIEVLDSIRQLHAISDQISSEDFAEFVEKGMVYQRRILGAFGFVQRIDHVTRQMLNQPGSNTNVPNPDILEPDDDGTLRTAAPRPEYYPLTYQTPSDALHVPLGFDFNSMTEYRSAIDALRQSGKTVLAGEIFHQSPQAATNVFYLFSPILYGAIEGLFLQPPGYLVGFTVALFDPETVLSRVRGIIPSHTLDFCLGRPASNAPFAESEDDPLHYAAPVRVANQTWMFHCRAGDEYITTRGTRQPQIILAAGLLITMLLTIELMMMAGRAQRTEQLVQTRTNALLEAKDLLENEMAERARLENEILEIGNREKLRVGQDLHDSLGQKLTAAVFLSRALSEKLDSGVAVEKEEARKINVLLKEAVSQVRRLARGLAPVELGDAGLDGALEQLVKDVQEAYGLTCVFLDHGIARHIKGKTAIHLYHIAQEALNNAARHGNPSRLGMTLTTDGSRGCLAVEDDGKGFDAQALQGQGMGLQIMRHRATMIGGTLEIGNRPGGGTRIACRFELEVPA